MSPIFTGSAVALVTPFTEEGVNTDALKESIDYQIENGTDALVVLGSTGEPATMTHRERTLVIKTAVLHTAHRVPVIVGAGSNNTISSIEDAKEIETLGADALLIAPPSYNKPTQEGILRHFTAIADSVSIPIIMYNIPGRTGCNMLPETVARLAAHPRIAAIKEASGNLSQIARIAALTRDMDFCLYSGNDDQVLPILSVGGMGVISVFANLCPRASHDMVAAYLSGDTKKATSMQLHYLKLINTLFIESNPIPVKAALALMGRKVGALRLPLCAPSAEHEEVLKATLKQYGLL